MTEDTTDATANQSDSPLGSLTHEQCVQRLQEANRRLTDTPHWRFNDEQLAVLRHTTGPQLVTAGPGTGKSTVTVAQVLKWLLVDGVQPEAIVLTTFTEKAARSLEQRLEAWLVELGYSSSIPYERIWVGTLHQLCAEIMREFRYGDYQNVELLDADAQEMFISQKCGDYIESVAGGDVTEFSPRKANDEGGCSKATATSVVTTLFNRLSQYCADIEALKNSNNGAHQRLAEGYEQYLDSLRENSRCDFARLQERFLDFLETDAGLRFVQGDPDRGHPGIQRVAVDEYQDVNPLQQEVYFSLAERMATSNPTLVVCGDDDQALYRFRGGTVDCLIEFPERISDRLGIDENAVGQENLRVNYRSRPGIVDWSNRHIADSPVMQEHGARAAGKQPLEAFRSSTPDPNVFLHKADTKQAAAEAFAEQVEHLHDEGYIEDYRQVALLAHSTREVWTQYSNETFVGACVRALEARGIPAFNPRNKGFAEQEEVQLMLGALARCVDPHSQWGEENVHPYGGFGQKVQDWDTKLEAVLADDSINTDGLEAVISRIQREIRTASPDSVLNLTLIDIYNKIRAQNPFSEWTGTDGDAARTMRLGKLSQLVESFEGIASGVTHSRNLTRTSRAEFETTSTRFLSDFYWTFLQYLNNVDLDDPEDPYAGTPPGHVQVMTVHQAKGLEFPVVYVASLDRTVEKVVTYEDKAQTTPAPTIADILSPYCERTPTTDVETRAERDLVRQFYVAHSRAKEKLVLLGTNYYLRPADGTTVVPSLGTDGGVPLTAEWFSRNQRLDKGATLFQSGTSVGPVSDDAPKRTYSVVGDALAVERCIRQYGFLVEYKFAGSSSTQLFAGLAVHQTLDWAHRYYNGDVDGATGGSPPSTEKLREEFDTVVDSLRDQRILPMSNDAIESVFEHVARFNETVGPSLYPKVVDTECRLRANAGKYLLTGVADVITDDDGDRTLVDYKASKRPEKGHKYLQNYHDQLLVYAGLYFQQEGEYPESAVLYFINEDNPVETRYEVEFTPTEVEAAMATFEETVRRIETTRENNSWSDLDSDDLPDPATCDECPVRFDCPERNYSEY
ncbi:ATP-dependent helicase [Haloferax sp. AB510]|uniref:ATP-dependent DNA helicase n=1 Tax=Haloferax sp. AB510 TaxID=2934172 RepID=UPI00209BEC54|nr:ATP-dependent DNA helicase [Haloferax sp. AB510]MCO8268618.1 ATP-dependent helicase [Haloferax sp. AB510]